MMDRAEFLRGVRKYIESDPEAAAHVADYVQAGLRESLNKALDRAADMEVIAATMAGRKYKGSEELIKSKLRSLDGHTALNWSWFIGEDE